MDIVIWHEDSTRFFAIPAPLSYRLRRPMCGRSRTVSDLPTSTAQQVDFDPTTGISLLSAVEPFLTISIWRSSPTMEGIVTSEWFLLITGLASVLGLILAAYALRAEFRSHLLFRWRRWQIVLLASLIILVVVGIRLWFVSPATNKASNLNSNYSAPGSELQHCLGNLQESSILRDVELLARNLFFAGGVLPRLPSG